MALATDLIWENQGSESARVKGVITDAGNFEAPVVIDASGLHSLLARKAGLVRWGTDKIMLAIKYIYRVDGELLRQRLQTYYDSDGVETDWGAMPTMAGDTPEFWGSHAVACPGRGIVNIIIYQCLREAVKARVNIHQRMQWYLQQPPINRLIEGGEFVCCNFHCLSSGDLVGYPPKAYLPGLMLVGDAGGFAQVVDNFGANVAQVQGRMAAELAAEMKAKNDYSEAMFARYDAMWRDSFIGEDNVPEMNVLMRNGGFQKLVGCIDEAASTFFKKRTNNTSYPSIVLNVLPKMLQALPPVLEAPYMMKTIAAVGVKKASALLAMFGMASEK